MAERIEDLARELVMSLVDSFEKLELLVACAQSGGALPRDVLVETLRIERGALDEATDELVAAGVLTESAAGVALEGESRVMKNVTALVTLYGANRMLVVTMMSQAAMTRLRQKADRVFADAFVIGFKRRRPPDKADD